MKLEPISDEQLIESLRQDILEQADQIGGLTSELEQLRDVYTATAELLQIREEQVQQLLKDVSDSQQQLAASQAETATLRDVFKRMPTWMLERNFIAVPRDRWNRWLTDVSNALTTPSAAAERMQALVDAVRVFFVDIDRYEDCMTAIEERPTVTGMRDALAALDAATDRNPRTAEEVKGE